MTPINSLQLEQKVTSKLLKNKKNIRSQNEAPKYHTKNLNIITCKLTSYYYDPVENIFHNDHAENNPWQDASGLLLLPRLMVFKVIRNANL